MFLLTKLFELYIFGKKIYISNKMKKGRKKKCFKKKCMWSMIMIVQG